MKTITHKGKVYEIGRLYRTECGYGELTGFSKDDNYFVIHNNGHRSEHFNIFEINKEDLGTIKGAPIKLENGRWYMCHWEVQIGNESCEHIRQPLKATDGRFDDAPKNALLLKPLYKMVKAD